MKQSDDSQRMGFTAIQSHFRRLLAAQCAPPMASGFDQQSGPTASSERSVVAQIPLEPLVLRSWRGSAQFLCGHSVAPSGSAALTQCIGQRLHAKHGLRTGTRGVISQLVTAECARNKQSAPRLLLEPRYRQYRPTFAQVPAHKLTSWARQRWAGRGRREDQAVAVRCFASLFRVRLLVHSNRHKGARAGVPAEPSASARGGCGDARSQ
eukprot:COSAG05_NODE_4501_length_1487_cov_73.479107_1_plen_209_part_00